MRHGSIPDTGGLGRRCRLPELPRAYSTESDPVQRLLAFAYLQSQKDHRAAEQELRKDADTLSAVLAAQAQIAAAQLNLEQSLEFIAEGARRLTGAGGAAIALRKGEKVVCRGRSGLMAPELGSYLNPQSGVCGACLTSGEVQLCDDTEHDRRVDIGVCRSLGMRSILAVPLRRQQDVLGIVVVFSGWAGVFGERDIRALKLLAGLVLEALWSHEVREREHTVPEPESSEPAELTADSIAAAMAEFREAIASAVLPEPAVAIAAEAEEQSGIETPAQAEAELPAPAFAVLGSAGPRRTWETLAVVAVVIAVLVGATEVAMWRGAHVRKLLQRFRPATPHIAAPVPPAIPASESPNAAAIPESAASATPELSSDSAAGATASQLLAIRSWSKPEGTTIALFLQAPARWQAGRLKDPARIYFDLDNTQLAGDMAGKSREGLAIPVNDGLVDRVRVGLRESSGVRIVIDLAAPAEYSAVLSATEPYRLMIVVRSTQAPAGKPANPGLAPSNKVPTAPATPPPRATLTHPKIVIDAGHGGMEDGAIGHGGLKEKDLTLQISKRLGDLLANRLGAQVIYTRTADLTVPLEARAAIANQVSADLFISVHANSSDDPGARGVETYYVASTPSPGAVSLAGRDARTKASALKPATEDFKLGESHKLAVQVQQALYHAFGRGTGVLNRGVKQAPFVVLLDVEMPSILAEVGFITSPADEHKLSTSEGQEAIADALYRGIVRYLSSAKGGKVVASLAANSGQ
jgi:N-acetylmuramoyl-L-alanine amidase/GAF domain-containing protein